MQTQVNTSVKISSELHHRIKKLAETRNRTAHSIMLQALEVYIGHEEKREALRLEAIRAHEDYILNGLHLTNNEAKEWLTQLADGCDAELPKCHI